MGGRFWKRGIVAGLACILLAATAAPSAAEPAPHIPPGPWRFRVNLVTFDGTTSGLTVAEIRDRIFGAGSESLKSFVYHVSGGRTVITGDVAPVQTVTAADPCDPSTWWNSPALVPSGYDYWLTVTPEVERCGFAGTAQHQGRLSWINGPDQVAYAIRHELGHNLGFRHTTNEDPYNTMGRGCDYQAAEKVEAGWLDNVTTVTAHGTYSVTSTHTPTGRALRIPTGDASGTEVWVEVRDWSRPAYVWEGQPCVEPRGVVIRVVPRDVSWAPTTLLYDSGLKYFTAGRGVQVPDSNMQICVRSLQPGAATVEVSPNGTGLCGLPAQAAPTGFTGVRVDGGEVVFRARGGMTNRVEIIDNGSGIEIRDSASINVGPGCVASYPGRVWCNTFGEMPVLVDLGDGDDRATVSTSTRVAVVGGPGDDEFTAGRSKDGRTMFVGGDGSDSVSYRYRTDTVHARLDNLANDGAIGEGDDVRDDVEHLRGGSGNDVLSGTAAHNTIRGGGGADFISGGDGSDRLYGDDGDDRIEGQVGDDKIDGGTGADVVDGGLGNDTLRGGRSGPDRLDGGDGNDKLSSYNRVRDTDVKCGPGADTARFDLIDVVAADCERRYGR